MEYIYSILYAILKQIRELKASRHHAEVQITDEGDFVLKAVSPIDWIRLV